MTLSKWKDGYRFDTDPRREDPLFYYRRDKDWDTAIGIQVDPEYDEHIASEVMIRIFPQHKSRITHFSEEELEIIYGRIMTSLLKTYPRWSSVKVDFPYTASVTRVFSSLDFDMSDEADTRWQHWIKNPAK